MRDAFGLVVDQAADPLTWALQTEFGNRVAIAMAGIDFVTQVDQLKQAEESSIDFYSFLRSSYYQTRRAQLREAVGLPPVVETPMEGTPTSIVRTPPPPPRP
ncbi:MAG: VacJ family lipoprotein, partial [Methylobacteriaceae bacterium]|nr:VacJ family lipoprotein [Methylobacteriaceae bacterium]